MAPINWKDYDDARDESIVLETKVNECSSNTPKQALKFKESIDYLFDHSDQEEDDMERDRDLSNKLKESIEKFSRNCSCKSSK